MNWWYFALIGAAFSSGVSFVNGNWMAGLGWGCAALASVNLAIKERRG